ncbi:hypothetical protein Glove_510g9 [Diversispora epigaea]|uniref:Uncharacterized protein n=1 Tax=Diversispora epigaea TaxID=1348612 RepID=A0A397GG13_9GLOM|nr:hypothetical protein Glove_510g9 [Diversispora epigaea]
MDTPYLKSYYRRGSTFLSSEQIETIRMLKGKVPKYRIIRDFHIHENRIDDIWENCERQQQVIQNTPYLKSYYRRGSTFLSSEQIETIRMLKGKVPKYRIIRDFHIHENRIDDIWENCERQQQVIQSTISSEILPMSTILPENSNRIESEVLLQSRPLSDELEIRDSASSLNHNSSNLHLEYDTLPNKETKKKKSKSKPIDKNLNVKTSILYETEKLDEISIETIPPEILQETEGPLELFKRTQKDAKKSRADVRADISKLSILNSKV